MAVLILVSTFLTHSAAATSPELGIEERKASRSVKVSGYKVIEESDRYRYDRTHKASFVGICGALREIYDAPICFEWPFINEDGSGNEAIVPEGPFEIHEGQKLSSALQEALAIGKEVLVLKKVHGSFCIVPSPNAQAKAENTMDTIISMKIEGASTWEAFKAWFREVNKNPLKGRKVSVLPMRVADEYSLPPEFTDAHSISLDLQNVTARQAACAIIQASPLSMDYTYQNFGEIDLPKWKRPPTASLRLHIYEKGKYSCPPVNMPPDEHEYWIEELRIMNEELWSSTPTP